MAEKQIDIVKAIKGGYYHSSFILSYSCDLAFYESVLLSSLRSTRCRNNALIVDEEKYQESLDIFAGFINHAGYLYSVTPIQQRGSFHPKIIFLLGDNEVALLIGTGNASVGGYSRNREIFFHLKAGNLDEKNLGLILDAWNLIKQVVEHRPGFIKSQLEMAEKETPIILEAQKREGSPPHLVKFKNGSIAALITSRNKDSLLSQFHNLVKGTKVQSLTLVSPFFDPGVKTIKSLLEAFDPKILSIIIQPETVNIDTKSLTSLNGRRIKLYRFKAPHQGPVYRSEPFLHSKAIFIQTRDGEHSLIGSANTTFSALGDMKSAGLNTEACLYAYYPEVNYLLSVLGLNESLVEKALLTNKQLAQIRWRKKEKDGQGEVLASLLGVEYSSEKLVVYCGDKLTPNRSWKMELLDESNLTVGLCKAHSIDNQIIIFSCDDTLIKKARKARVLIGLNERSKTYIINRISELSYNSPNTEVRKAWLAVESIQLGSSDLSALIEPVEKLLYYIPHPSRSGRGGRVREEKEGNQGNGESEEEKKVPYGEFVADVVWKKVKRGSFLLSDGSALGLLTEFLLSRIGYREGKSDTNIPDELVSDIYIEEDLIGSSEGKEITEEVIKIKIKKKMKISNNQFDNQQKKLYKLADRYYEYLDDLLRERGEEELGPIEIVKYFVVMLLLTHFAGKEISIKSDGKGSKRVMFPLYDGWDYDFIYYGFGITSKFFSVAPKPIVERISFLEQFHSMPDDLVSAIALGAYVLTALILCSEKNNYKEVTNLEMSTIRLYMNARVTKDMVHSGSVRKLFEGFHNQAGFGKVISLNAIYKKHEELLWKTGEYEKKVKNARKLFQEKGEQLRKKFRFPPVIVGDVVWNVRSGIGIVERIEENSRVVVSNPGYSHYDQNMNGYGRKIEHEIKIVQGYLVKIDP